MRKSLKKNSSNQKNKHFKTSKKNLWNQKQKDNNKVPLQSLKMNKNKKRKRKLQVIWRQRTINHFKKYRNKKPN